MDLIHMHPLFTVNTSYATKNTVMYHDNIVFKDNHCALFIFNQDINIVPTYPTPKFIKQNDI